jgi:hypothetical protein
MDLLHPQLREHVGLEPQLFFEIIRKPNLVQAQLLQARAARRRHEAGKEVTSAVSDRDPFEREIRDP